MPSMLIKPVAYRRKHGGFIMPKKQNGKICDSEKRRTWPENCPWAEPVSPYAIGSIWDVDDVEGMALDEDGEDLLEIREYMDSLVECGRLLPDYSLNDEYEDDDSGMDSDGGFFRDTEDPEEGAEMEDASFWEPYIGEDYWDDGFDVEAWEQDLLAHVNCLKTDPVMNDPVTIIGEIIGYEFINENLLRQAFTRRAFAVEYKLSGDSENLEFIGDTALQLVVTREIQERFLEVNLLHTDAPLCPINKQINEGILSKARSQYVSREYLASRAVALGLDKLILFGSGEERSESACEDALEALIGAVAVDSKWNWDVLGDVVDHLLCLQLDYPDRFLKQSFYDLFNAWHQKHFGAMPVYEVYGGRRNSADGRIWYCTIRFLVPENDMGIETHQRMDVDADGRSKARELAAEMAYGFVKMHGLWIRLSDANVEPRMEDAINQLQELYQKKYVASPVEYTFEELSGDQWECHCICAGMHGSGMAGSKTAAKKKAAYRVLVELLAAGGCCKKEWQDEAWRI